jgi:hypothetical protein
LFAAGSKWHPLYREALEAAIESLPKIAPSIILDQNFPASFSSDLTRSGIERPGQVDSELGAKPRRFSGAPLSLGGAGAARTRLRSMTMSPRAEERLQFVGFSGSPLR